jgi:SAM-dependent methyltransferase
VVRRTAKLQKKLHIGCGDVALPGWVNIDLAPYPAVDLVHDVTKPLPFENCSFIFAEHFIEHLSLQDGLRFLQHCRRALADNGVLRLTTPNLDWVWKTHYHPDQWSSAEDATNDCLQLNRAFYGWGHRFLFNWQTLDLLLRQAGFATTVQCSRGISDHVELQNLERHEEYPDTPDLPHVLVVEASGRLEDPLSVSLSDFPEYRRNTEAPFHQLQYAALTAVRLLKRAFRRRED